ncbi:MAG: Bug family tripartite tricarboxylate transporter substrate binding protein [Pigmentiphaga sp.]
MKSKIAHNAALILGAGLLTATVAHANPTAPDTTFPKGPITMLVGFAPGGGTDALARLVANALSQKLAQPVVVENRPGANGILATNTLSASKPDGYTLLFTIPAHVTNPLISPNATYDVLDGFAPVSKVSTTSWVLVAPPTFPPDTVSEVVDRAKTTPTTYGSPGVASTPSLAMELFNADAGINMTHVPYKGSGPALVDLLAGRIDLMLATTFQASQHLAEGKLKGIAILTDQRDSLVPDIPTSTEAGWPDFQLDVWTGIFAPKGTPEAVVQKLSDAVGSIMNDEATRRDLAAQGFETAYLPSEQFQQQITDEYKLWEDVIKNNKIQFD